MARRAFPYRLWMLLTVAQALLPCSSAAQGSYFSSSQGPGPLGKVHQDLACAKCHVDDGRQVLAERCLSCHLAIQQQLAPKRGLHGNPQVAALPCERCHGEHKRNPDRLAGWSAIGGKQHFDHQLTGYPLLGAHQAVACERCHRSSSRQPIYRDAPSLCQSCHRSPHGELRPASANCQHCHTLKAWQPPLQPLQFNHQTDTSYPLERQHSQVPCLGCHARSQYVLGERAQDCTPCHQKVHGDSILSKRRCDGCHHGSVVWQAVRFDHQLTGFRLTGQHARVECRACHRGLQPGQFEDLSYLRTVSNRDDPSVAAPVQCLGCHQHRNAHQGKFRNDECMKCHREPGEEATRTGKAAWRSQASLGHGPGKPFQLRDGHNQVPCMRCHPQGRYTGISPQCGPACHADVHLGALGQDCLRCHLGALWTAVGFDHQRSRFLLTGRHQQVACASCHPAPTYKPRPMICSDAQCHQSSDAHGGRLGAECERCHDTSAWGRIHTGHDLTPEPFGGAHDRLPCVRCHLQGRRLTGMAAVCIVCHQRDDLHNNSLGPRCGDCHTQQSFVGARFSHDTVGCSLRGMHRILPCVDCHKGGNYFGLSPICVSCHRDDALRALTDPRLSRRVDVAAAHLSGSVPCNACHNLNSFHPASAARGSGGDSVCQ